MLHVTREFTQYLVYYLTGGSPSVGVPHSAEIDCFDASGQRAGALYFHSGNAKLPQNQETVNGIYLYFRMTRFADVMDLLRHEKPLSLNLDTDSKVGYLGTSAEPVGEGEPA